METLERVYRRMVEGMQRTSRKAGTEGMEEVFVCAVHVCWRENTGVGVYYVGVLCTGAIAVVHIALSAVQVDRIERERMRLRVSEPTVCQKSGICGCGDALYHSRNAMKYVYDSGERE